MNSWLYITLKLPFSLYIGVYYVDAVSAYFHHISKIVPKWLESSWPRKVLCASPPARTWRVACLRSEIVNRTPNLRRHNDHITIIKNTPPPSENPIRKAQHSDKKGLLCAFSTFSAGRMPPNFWKFTNFGSLAYDWSTALASHHGPRTETSAKI